MRTLGVEEELLLVDPASGRPVPAAEAVIAASDRARGGSDAPAVPAPAGGPGAMLHHELQREQIEIDTAPHTELADLAADLRTWRARAVTAAGEQGVSVAALGTPPVPTTPHLFPDPRYGTMAGRFGFLVADHLVCGCHVHVAVEDAAEAAAVLDRIRVHLPTLLAISANSPFWEGRDSGYASRRSLVMSRWPSAGPTGIFGSAERYAEVVGAMERSGVIDRGMLYFDARASHRYPTVEIRVADVCLELADAVVVAALGRAFVETAAREWGAGRPPPPVAVEVLRLADWQAAHDGLGGELLDPVTAEPRPAAAVVEALLDHTREALEAAGDLAVVTERLERLLAGGTGADRQRRAHARTGDLAAVVADAVEATAAA